MIHTMRNRTRTGLVAALAALTASIAIGTAGRGAHQERATHL